MLDSASNDALSQEGVLSVKHIEMFLQDALKKNSLPQSKTFTLTPNAYMVRFVIQQCTVICIVLIAIQVSQQINSVDCGVHAMHNIKLAATVSAYLLK